MGDLRVALTRYRSFFDRAPVRLGAAGLDGGGARPGRLPAPARVFGEHPRIYTGPAALVLNLLVVAAAGAIVHAGRLRHSVPASS